ISRRRPVLLSLDLDRPRIERHQTAPVVTRSSDDEQVRVRQRRSRHTNRPPKSFPLQRRTRHSARAPQLYALLVCAALNDQRPQAGWLRIAAAVYCQKAGIADYRVSQRSRVVCPLRQLVLCAGARCLRLEVLLARFARLTRFEAWRP